MTGPILADDFEVSVNRDEVLRMAGVPKRGGSRAENAPPQALELYPAVLSQALELVRPRAIYMVCRASDVRYHKVFKQAVRLGFGICTIGPALEAEVAARSAVGESLRALMLDAIGSAAVECVVAQTASRLRAMAWEEGLSAGVRFSPGYGSWPLEWQREVFKIVDGAAIGVTLNDSCIMEPRKSVSFAVRIEARPAERVSGKAQGRASEREKESAKAKAKGKAGGD